MRWQLRSKIHKAVVAEADVNYVGSISIDKTFIDAVGLWPGDRVLVVSNTSGARLETFVTVVPAGSGAVVMNGAAAHLIGVGEEIIVMGFELADEPLKSAIAPQNYDWPAYHLAHSNCISSELAGNTVFSANF